MLYFFKQCFFVANIGKMPPTDGKCDAYKDLYECFYAKHAAVWTIY